MKKNGLLQTFFYDFLKIQVTGNTNGAYYRGQKGHGTAPCYFALDLTLNS